MTIESFPDDGADFNPKGMYKDLINGIHHVRLESTEKSIINGGPETLKGHPQIVWKFKVLDGPSAGSGLFTSTPLSGYIMSKKSPGVRVNMWEFTRKIVAALDPLWTNFAEFDRDALIGREAEINIETKKNPDGTTSVWVNKVLWIRPYVAAGSAGPTIVGGKDENDVPIHFL